MQPSFFTRLAGVGESNSLCQSLLLCSPHFNLPLSLAAGLSLPQKQRPRRCWFPNISLLHPSNQPDLVWNARRRRQQQQMRTE
jgi:hypothetical protein